MLTVEDSQGCWHNSVEDLLMCSTADGLGFCGCGNTDSVAEMLLKYLSSLPWLSAEYKKITDAKLSRFADVLHGGLSQEATAYAAMRVAYRAQHSLADKEFLLIAYIADRAQLTEHGGSVYGAWLTDKGTKWVEMLTASAAGRYAS